MEIKEKILDPEVRRHSFILDVHLMILDDQMLIQDTVDMIRKKKVNAEWALDLTLEKLDTAFKAIEDEYLRERRSDLHYVSSRIFRNLLGKKHDDITKIKGNVIVVAHDLSPADTLQMNLKQCGWIHHRYRRKGLPHGHPLPFIRHSCCAGTGGGHLSHQRRGSFDHRWGVRERW